MKSCCIHISFVPCAADWIVCSCIPPQSTNECHQSRIPEHSEQVKWKQLLRQLLAVPIMFSGWWSGFWKSWLLPGWECLGWVHALSQCDWPHVASWIWQSTHNLAHGTVCVGRVWEWGGYKSSLGGTRHPAKLSQRGCDCPSWATDGVFCIAQAQKDHVAVTAQRCWAGRHHLGQFAKAFPSRRDTVPFLPFHETGMSLSECWLKKCIQLLVLNT